MQQCMVMTGKGAQCRAFVLWNNPGNRCACTPMLIGIVLDYGVTPGEQIPVPVQPLISPTASIVGGVDGPIRRSGSTRAVVFLSLPFSYTALVPICTGDSMDEYADWPTKQEVQKELG